MGNYLIDTYKTSQEAARCVGQIWQRTALQRDFGDSYLAADFSIHLT